jgi:hypothetical protein
VRLAAYLVIAVSAVAPAAAQQAWPNSDLKRGTLSFDGKSTLGDFTGTTTTVHGQMTGGKSVVEVRGWVDAPVNTLKTANDRRDRDLVKTMGADVYPTIRFELAGVTSEWERGDSLGVVLDGRFVIHGVTRQESVKAIVVRGPDGVHLTASLPMNLHDYKIDKLTRFLVFKMDPDIVVHVDLFF